ncbi:hypothetical protein Aab01nite_09150 [Paractinoplanes abujensis]|uniref:Uncharacterized protein n=1 Tax=Paractinoplanes abujensis TaxID=882441 RepID=A0A7W7CMF1_9ACTN|nr:hypothetical protein [Actinoplanes abujensis]MBB4691260.1 hypothetical protein [Actinoplanes abujensis]GID17325.1 hypothetical protein Aab01nite_09150 [Actinoplanes abujensis]
MDGSARPPQTDDVELPPTGEYALVPETGEYDNSTYAGSAEQPRTVSLPKISDYWPDAEKPPPPLLPAEAPELPRRRVRLLAVAAGVLLLAGIGAVVLTRLAGNDAEPAPTGASDPEIIVEGTPNPPVAIEPAPTPTSAPATSAPPTRASPPPPAGPAFAAGTFVLASGLTELNVSLGRPPRNGIAKVASPDGSGVVPDADLDGTELRLTAERKGDKGTGDVNVLLDERITWTIRMEGGVRRGTFDMANGSVRDFYFEGGANRLELALPRQERTIEIRMAGGVREWRIGTEGEFPVKVKVRKGAGEISLNGDRDEGVDRGEVVRSRGGDDKSGGLAIEAVAGIGSLKVSPL